MENSEENIHVDTGSYRVNVVSYRCVLAPIWNDYILLQIGRRQSLKRSDVIWNTSSILTDRAVFK